MDTRTILFIYIFFGTLLAIAVYVALGKPEVREKLVAKDVFYIFAAFIFWWLIIVWIIIEWIINSRKKHRL